MGARGERNGDHEFQMCHVGFEMTLEHPQGCFLETSCDVELDFCEEWDLGIYI